jgi:hypothetical protein
MSVDCYYTGVVDEKVPCLKLVIVAPVRYPSNVFGEWSFLEHPLLLAVNSLEEDLLKSLEFNAVVVQKQKFQMSQMPQEGDKSDCVVRQVQFDEIDAADQGPEAHWRGRMQHQQSQRTGTGDQLVKSYCLTVHYIMGGVESTQDHIRRCCSYWSCR